MNLVSAKRPYIPPTRGVYSLTAGGMCGPRPAGPSWPRRQRYLQHNPAKDKAEDHAQRDSDNAGDQEGVVKDIFTNAG